MVINKQLTLIYLLGLLSCSLIQAQQKEKILEADTLHLRYNFSEAIEKYNSILKSNTTDSITNILISNKIIECENGINLLKYSINPTVIAKKQSSVNDFYLYLPDFQSKGWIKIPNPFVNDNTHIYQKATYFPNNNKKVIFSASDNSGSWNIYESELIGDGLWSEPKIISENITSTGDEIFPILSRDGKELYFSSNGHFGMGGFDLYVSRWDEEGEEWSIPENLGFPYSSTSDDLLYMNTSDGLYSIVVSNRNTAADSVDIFVIEYIATPIKSEIENIDKVRKIAALDVIPVVKNDETLAVAKDTSIINENKSNLNQYTTLVSKVRSLKGEQKKILDKLKENRSLYETVTNEGDKTFIADIIKELEIESVSIKNNLDAAVSNVQKAEMDFLSKGIVPPINEEYSDSTVLNNYEQRATFTFNKGENGDTPEIVIQKSKPIFDYSFKVGETSVFAENNTLPDGIIYQIQISVLLNKGNAKNFKGLSPIFERLLPSKKYLYTVGLFYKYSEVLSCLNQVKKKGFPNAFIVAYKNGKSIPVKQARTMESTISKNSSFQVILSKYPDGIPSSIMTTIKGACDKDIAKSSVEGKIVYIVGPFSQKAEAEQLVTLLTDIGIDGVTLETIKM